MRIQSHQSPPSTPLRNLNLQLGLPTKTITDVTQKLISAAVKQYVPQKAVKAVEN
jgi:hypothetical protein